MTGNTATENTGGEPAGEGKLHEVTDWQCKHVTYGNKGAEDDGEWSDIVSENDNDATSSVDHGRSTDDDTSASQEDVEVSARSTYSPFTSRTQLTSPVPNLFSKTLPPCGPIPQVAYENVNYRLRKLWLQRTADTIDNHPVSLLSICRTVKETLDTEAENFPHTGQPELPWRRQDVMLYELRWAAYFIREAELLEKSGTMSEGNKARQRYMDRLFPVLRELRIVVRNGVNKQGVLEKWRVWNRGKRGCLLEEVEGEGLENED